MAFSNAYPGASNCMPSRAIIMTGTHITRTQMWTPGSRQKEDRAYEVPGASQRDSKGDGIIRPKFWTPPSSLYLKFEKVRLPKRSLWEMASWSQWAWIRYQRYQWLGSRPIKEILQRHQCHPHAHGCGHRFCHNGIQNRIALLFVSGLLGRPYAFGSGKILIQKYKRKLAGKSWDHDWIPTYAAMIETVDTNVGRLYQAIQSAGIADDTYIFTSDNGGHAGATPNASAGPKEPSTKEVFACPPLPSGPAK